MYKIQYKRFQFGNVGTDFWSSTMWAFHIEASFAEFKNAKNLGIQPIDSTQARVSIDHFGITYRKSFHNDAYEIEFSANQRKA